MKETPSFAIMSRITIGVLLVYCSVVFADSSEKELTGEKASNPKLGRPAIQVTAVTIRNAPYIASVRIGQGTKHYCAGSIIHESYILTAAQCVFTVNEYSVVVGSDLLSEGGDKYAVSMVYIHDKYNANTMDYDVALLKLAVSLKWSSKVKKIRLPNSTEASGLHNRNSELYVTGWGNGDGDFVLTTNQLLRFNSLRILPSSMCVKKAARQNRKITPRMFCAGGFNKTPCRCDYGSPIIKADLLVGVTSTQKVCGMKPGIFTEVATVLQWIKTKLGSDEPL